MDLQGPDGKLNVAMCVGGAETGGPQGSTASLVKIAPSSLRDTVSKSEVEKD